ncbi:hypothetical protein LMJ41_31870 [Streptomyces globisporus]|nr:hypothetical protein [Streptomyces globisporus]
MNAVALTMLGLYHGERALTRQLTVIAERHSSEHDVCHVAKDLALWSDEHCRRLAETGGHYGMRSDRPSPSSSQSTTIPEHTAEDIGGRPEPALLLLQDLRDLHLAAAGNALFWEMLTQGAQAAKDSRLLELASFCHPRTLRQMRWTNTVIKNLSPQALISL